MKPVTVRQFFKRFPDDQACLDHLFETRFGQGHDCPKCERSARWYPLKSEKAFSCQWCGHHIHPMAGTIFENSRTPLQDWFYVFFMFTTTRNGVSAKEIQRQLGVTYKCAWRIGHKVREHMAQIDGDGILGGQVEVDEVFIGGHTPGGQGGKGKAIVMGMMEKGGDIITEVIPDRTGDSLMEHIEDHVAEGSEIHTDEHRGYNELDDMPEYTRRSVNHSAKEYVGPEGQTTNSVEGFFSQLRRTIEGTHISVSRKHLAKYAKECEFRFNRRLNPASMLPELLTRFPDRPAE